jgi:hypothetical protein
MGFVALLSFGGGAELCLGGSFSPFGTRLQAASRHGGWSSSGRLCLSHASPVHALQIKRGLTECIAKMGSEAQVEEQWARLGL